MSEYYRGGANVNDVATNSNIPTSGAIDIGDFYGTGNAVTVAASAGTNVDVAPLFASPDTFTNAVSKILTIAAPIAINGNNVALTVPSNMAGTLIFKMQELLPVQEVMVVMQVQVVMVAQVVQVAAISVLSNGVSLNNSGNVSRRRRRRRMVAQTGASSTNTVNFGSTNYIVLYN